MYSYIFVTMGHTECPLHTPQTQHFKIWLPILKPYLLPPSSHTTTVKRSYIIQLLEIDKKQTFGFFCQGPRFH